MIVKIKIDWVDFYLDATAAEVDTLNKLLARTYRADDHANTHTANDAGMHFHTTQRLSARPRHP